MITEDFCKPHFTEKEPEPCGGNPGPFVTKLGAGPQVARPRPEELPVPQQGSFICLFTYSQPAHRACGTAGLCARLARSPPGAPSPRRKKVT